MKKYFLIYLATLCCIGANAVDIKRYVKEGGTGNGLTWETATGDLETVLNLASQVDNLDVFVGEGTFTGNFKIEGNTRLLGQFAGNEGFHNSNMLTKLVGNIRLEGILAYVDVSGSVEMNQAVMVKVNVYGSDENGIHVFQTGGESRLTGCSAYQNKTGCSLYGGKLTMERCSFYDNEYSGFSTRDGSVIASGCYFGTNKGPGCELSNLGSSCRFSNCEFIENKQGGFIGGVISGRHVLERCRISDNTSTEPGAGIYASRNVAVYHSFIYNNESTHAKGSAVYVLSPNNYFCNCTLFNNKNGIYIEEGFAYEKAEQPLMTNCALWHNGADFINPANCTYQLEACALEGGTGIPELDAERGILTQSSENEGTGTAGNYPGFGDGLDLLPASCLINKGKMTGYENRDYWNRPCNVLGGYDIGASEYQGIYQWVAGSAPVTLNKEEYKLAFTTFKGVTYYSLISTQSVKEETGELVADVKTIYLGTKRNAYTVVAGTPYIGVYREGKAGEKAFCNILEWHEKAGWEPLRMVIYTAGKDKPVLRKHPTQKNYLNVTQAGRTSSIDVYVYKR